MINWKETLPYKCLPVNGPVHFSRNPKQFPGHVNTQGCDQERRMSEACFLVKYIRFIPLWSSGGWLACLPIPARCSRSLCCSSERRRTKRKDLISNTVRRFRRASRLFGRNRRSADAPAERTRKREREWSSVRKSSFLSGPSSASPQICCYGLMPYFFSLRYSVLRSMPSSWLALDWLFFASFRTRRM